MHEDSDLSEPTTAVSKNVTLKSISSFEVGQCFFYHGQWLALVHLSNSKKKVIKTLKKIHRNTHTKPTNKQKTGKNLIGNISNGKALDMQLCSLTLWVPVGSHEGIKSVWFCFSIKIVRQFYWNKYAGTPQKSWENLRKPVSICKPQ